MSVIKSLILAFSMYSRIPVPHVRLEEKDMKYTFGFFPLVGVVIGALFSGWLIFARKFCIGTITSMCVSGVFLDRKSTRLNSSHNNQSRMPSSA